MTSSKFAPTVGDGVKCGESGIHGSSHTLMVLPFPTSIQVALATSSLTP